MAEHMNKTDARQGKTGMGVRYVLIASIVLAVIALLIVAGFIP